ncbi:hypothetical protein SELMODRAFT_413345 [Selaginella moellendorffii]|uniref:Uncharacterized protein n=1 Tax=Selaginella moellendorffii TaxID=88036 RepID=D8RP60_SELML|nr:hypothetical protein SELMODRAFT_413345 [Selaginella moellendorffii]
MDHCSTFFAPAMTSLASATAQQFSSSCGTRCDSRRDCSSGLVCNPVSKTYDGDPGASTLSCPIPGCEPGKTFVNSNATAHNPEYCIGNNIYQFFNCSPEEQSLNFAAFYYIKLEELPTACNQSTPYKNSELLANMATGWFASGSSCFKEIVITAENGMSVTATVADTTSRARPDRWEGREVVRRSNATKKKLHRGDLTEQGIPEQGTATHGWKLEKLEELYSQQQCIQFMARNHASLVLFFACLALGFSVETARESFTYSWTPEERQRGHVEGAGKQDDDCTCYSVADGPTSDAVYTHHMARRCMAPTKASAPRSCKNCTEKPSIFGFSCALFRLHGSGILSGGSQREFHVLLDCRGECNEASNTEIKDCSGSAIASVCGGFSSEIHVEGAGRLKDGRYVNCKDNDCTYFVTDGPKGSRENDSQLYVSIAVPDEGKYPFGSHLKIDLLQDIALPNGRQHNGCVRVDDACMKDKEKNNECNMDFYVGSESNYLNIDHELQDAELWDANIDPNCQIQD